MAEMLEWPQDKAMLIKHPKTVFGRNDSMVVPVGKTVIVVKNSDFSPVYREGDSPVLQKGFFKQQADVYMIDVQASNPLEWGIGDIRFRDKRCGMNGKLTLQVVSVNKFLTKYITHALPLTAETILGELFGSIAELIRRELVLFESGEDISEAALRERLASSVADVSADGLEDYGLAIVNMTIEPLFYPDEQEA